MATTTVARTRKASRSTVALKAVMAVSGLIMIGFLLGHMYGNLKVFAGQAAFDEYAHHLRVIGEPILPKGGALWIMRVVLLVAILAHMYSAFSLWSRARTARGTAGGGRRYQTRKAPMGVQRTYASYTLRWGGIVIALFVIYHLLHLTFNVVAPGGAADSPYLRVANGFQIWWVVAVYTIAMVAVGMHLRHGTWSALTTLGANTSPVARRRLNLLAYAVALLITIGFLLPPYAIMLGVVS